MNRNTRKLVVKGFLLGIPLAILTIAIVVSACTREMPVVQTAEPTETEVTFDMTKNTAYTSDDGVVVIGGTTDSSTKKADIQATNPLPTNSATPSISSEGKSILAAVSYTLPKEVEMKNGSLGVLSIPKISVSVNIYETDDEMEAMTKGLAHFKTTSSWTGNIGLCGHNVNFDGTKGYLYSLHKLKTGDSITYKTALGTLLYKVQTVKEIAETDWSYLGRCDDNRITLITCITGKPTSRLVVQAVESNT